MDKLSFSILSSKGGSTGGGGGDITFSEQDASVIQQVDTGSHITFSEQDPSAIR